MLQPEKRDQMRGGTLNVDPSKILYNTALTTQNYFVYIRSFILLLILPQRNPSGPQTDDFLLGSQEDMFSKSLSLYSPSRPVRKTDAARVPHKSNLTIRAHNNGGHACLTHEDEPRGPIVIEGRHPKVGQVLAREHANDQLVQRPPERLEVGVALHACEQLSMRILKKEHIESRKRKT
jgi:hypothetical protein